ncbi:FAD-dependent oxidoreductase [Streptomyces sp. NPDC101455]|uniref:FAD-dependent oxidoreductase n=1 Tax=Streptomyces sp. NPDC101455 TaxID=3366142 RepID=UPI0038086B19
MAHIITQNCCNDAACVPVCPVNCIHPSPGEPGYGTAEMLYIDNNSCIDCGACVDVCPVGAIFSDDDLPPRFARYADINARFYADPNVADYDPYPQEPQRVRWTVQHDQPLRVAVVGSGPAGCYAAEELLSQRGLNVRVDMFERLPTPWGLVRGGVAPDHQETKAAASTFERITRRKGCRLFLNVNVGTDVTHADLLDRYHAVIYAVGAMGDRRLAIEGEDLPGSHSVTEFVAWYNGHPDYVDRVFDFSHERAVILGNGNVALDVARILTLGIDALAKTDIADHALEQLSGSNIRDVTIVGRRGPEQASFTTPELLGLTNLDGVGVAVHRPPTDSQETEASVSASVPEFSMVAFKAEVLDEIAATAQEHDRRITLQFQSSPKRILGADRAEAVELVWNDLIYHDGAIVARPTENVEVMECGLVLRSVGYRGKLVAGLPFDDVRGVLPNVDGRVTDPTNTLPLPGVYTTGWIKRGPSGVIGTNKACARETVMCLLQDWVAGTLPEPSRVNDDVVQLVPDHLDAASWKTIDAHERASGRESSRPRVKVVDRDALIRLGRSAHS